MTGGHYSNQLFNDYQKLASQKDVLVSELKKQTQQHKLDLAHLEAVLQEKVALEKINGQIEHDLQEKDQKIEALVKEVARLNQILGNNSQNSGIPTSQTAIDKKKRVPNSRVQTGKKKGGQIGHKQVVLQKFKEEEINACEEHGIFECPYCQGEVEKIAEGKTKDETDYEMVLIKKRHFFPLYQCKDCHKKMHAPIPDHLKAENQYGPHVQAMGLTFMNEGNVSINKTQTMIQGFTFGEIVPSQGYLAKLQGRAAKRLASFSEEMRKHLLKQSLVYWDDTVIMVNQNRACLRFYGNEKLALFKAHPQKNKIGVLHDQLLTLLNEQTKVVHDHNTLNYGAEFSYTNVECNAHLLRDLRKCAENTRHDWAEQLSQHIHETYGRRSQLIEAGGSEFSLIETSRFFQKLNELWLLGEEENRKDKSLYYAQKERALLNRLKKYRIEYFSWVEDFELPFTNNVSERSLRGVKSKMKIAGQFQNIPSAKNYAMIRTYTETCKRHGLNGVEALRRACEGRPYTLNEVLTTK